MDKLPRLPCGGPRPAPRPASPQSLGQGDTPISHPTTQKISPVAGTQDWAAPSLSTDAYISFELRVVSRWHMLIEGLINCLLWKAFGPPVQNEPLRVSQRLVWPFAGCVTLGDLLNLSEPRFLPL